MDTEKKPEARARLHATVHGYVQGVNFRTYTAHAAQRLGLVGWVANRWDGTVETVAEGGQGALNEFLAFLRRGSPSAVVEKVNIAWETPTGEFERFKVRSTL